MPKRKLPKNAYFAENLKQIRKESGLTQEFVAEQIHVNRSTYTKWETGNSEPSFTCVAMLIELFNKTGKVRVDYNDMFGKS